MKKTLQLCAAVQCGYCGHVVTGAPVDPPGAYDESAALEALGTSLHLVVRSEGPVPSCPNCRLKLFSPGSKLVLIYSDPTPERITTQ